MREVSRVADKRLVAETEGSEIDGDLLARREHYLALPQGRPDHLDTQRVPVTFWPSAPSSQNRWPNSWVVSLELMSFSIRSVARPLNGVELLCVGVVE